MTSQRAWTIVFVILALTPLFFYTDGVRLHISDVAVPWRLVYAAIPGTLAFVGATRGLPTTSGEARTKRRRGGTEGASFHVL